jgi:hypothetical protein
MLTSIENIRKIIPTKGSTPVLVHCSDLNDYVCKYDQLKGKLFNEYLAVRFSFFFFSPIPYSIYFQIYRVWVFQFYQ